MKREPTRSEQLWMYACLVGTGLGLYLVANGAWHGYFLGCICVAYLGMYVEKHYGEKPRREPQPTFRPISWKEEYLRLKGWDNMTEGHRHVFSNEITSSAMGMGGTALKKELAELKARYPDQKALLIRT
jgi:hypothetical protein